MWPRLDYEEWKDTYQTLHLWLQIIGKVRLSHKAWANHSWYSTLYVTSKGLSTSAIPLGTKTFSLELDFNKHALILTLSDGVERYLPLKNESVASFYRRVTSALDELGIHSHFDPRPNELPIATEFSQDFHARVFNRVHAKRVYEVLVIVNNVLKEFRTKFLGKCSPVHFFWGSFDLAVTRFSGRLAPEHPGQIPHLPDRVAKEAYSHEVSSCGFWPGNEIYPHAAFYSYAYPAPKGFSTAKVKPQGTFFHKELAEFVLPYDQVFGAQNPKQLVMDFFESTYSAAAALGSWDRSFLEESRFRSECENRQLTAI